MAGFKELPDDSCEAIVLPKDLERASKLGDGWQHYGMIGLATVGSESHLGLGSDLINTRTVEGRFPAIDKVLLGHPCSTTFQLLTPNARHSGSPTELAVGRI